jgi:hypothetical protein
MAGDAWPRLRPNAGIPDFLAGKARRKEITRRAEELDPDEVVRRIVGTLPSFSGRQAELGLARKIRDWAAGYLGLQDVDDDRQEPSPQDLQRLRRIAKHGRAIINDFANLGEDTYERLLMKWPHALLQARGNPFLEGLAGIDAALLDTDARIKTNMIGLLLLVDAAEKAVELRVKRPRGRRPSSPARKIALKALAYTYEECTGRRPTRRYNPISGKNYGPFRAFVLAALTPIEGARARVGLDSAIARLLRPNRKRR